MSKDIYTLNDLVKCEENNKILSKKMQKYRTKMNI